MSETQDKSIAANEYQEEYVAEDERQEETVAAEGCQEELTPEERSALYSRWFDVALDIDRLLLTLSLACFGVLGTVLAGNILKTKLHYFLWAISCLAFLAEIVVVLCVVFLNKELLSRTLDKNCHLKMPWLDRFERASRYVFFVAVFCTAVFVAAVAFSQFDKLQVTSKEGVSNDQKAGSRNSDHGRPIEHAEARSDSKDERPGVDASHAGGSTSSETQNATSKPSKTKALNPESLGEKSP